MKKICFVTTVSITIKSFLIDFAKYLTEEDNFDVTFICSTDKALYDYCNERIHYIPVDIQRGVGFDGLKVINKITKVFKEKSFDIIQYSTPNAALYASIAAKKAGCPNRLYCQWGIRYMGFDGGWKRKLFKTIEKITCSNSTIIECESFSLYDFSVKEGLYPAEKASVIWNGSACGVNLARYDISRRGEWRKQRRDELGIPEDAFVFGFAGRITRDKGSNELIEAFKQIQEKHGNTYLLFLGSFDNEGTIKEELKNWAQQSSKVKFVEWTDKVEQYYCAMDVFASLSYREGFGLVVIEAAAMMLPGIVTDCPGQKDTIEPNVDGWLVPVKNVDKVVETMEHCIDNLDEVREYGKNARRHVEEKYEQKELFRQLTEHRNAIIS